MNDTPRNRQLARDSFAAELRSDFPIATVITVETAGRFTVRVFSLDSHAAHTVERRALRARTDDVRLTELQPAGYSILAKF